jgi:hypothetical protein
MTPVPSDLGQHGGNLRDRTPAGTDGYVTGSATGDDLNPVESAACDHESPGQDMSDISDDLAGHNSMRLVTKGSAMDGSSPQRHAGNRPARYW